MSAPAPEKLKSEPGLGGLYARALIGAVLPGGETLPDRRLVLEDVEIDREHVAAYDRVCGFRLSDRLAPTYLHIVAFPLQMALMTDRSFPFSVLGLVHIANRIEQRRALTADDRATMSVWARDLRPHRRGRQFDMVAEAQVGDETVWSSSSTYLRRGVTEGTVPSVTQEPDPPTEIAAHLEVPGDIGRRYAAVSGDRNPIHMHGLAARLFGMPGAIAHGMWMKARCLAAFEGRHPEGCVAEVAFGKPLRIPADVTLTSATRDDGLAFALRDGERLHLTGSIQPAR